MKVKIGKYPQWIGPYQIAEKIIFWADKYDDDDPWSKRQHKLGEWLAGGRGNHDNWLSKTCAWIHKTFQNAGERRVKIRIDDSDCWGADHTLALIIVPVLEKLKAHKNGSPFVEDVDLPPHLRMTKREHKVHDEGHWNKKLKASEEEQKAASDKFHARWEWVLDEMIWAFRQHADANWEDQFHSGEHDTLWQKVDVHGNKLGEPVKHSWEAPDDPEDDGDKTRFLWQMLRGPNDTHHYDREGAKAWSARMANGRRLFAKYYEGLWW